jgi:hypothetical protein
MKARDRKFWAKTPQARVVREYAAAEQERLRSAGASDAFIREAAAESPLNWTRGRRKE